MHWGSFFFSMDLARKVALRVSKLSGLRFGIYHRSHLEYLKPDESITLRVVDFSIHDVMEEGQYVGEAQANASWKAALIHNVSAAFPLKGLGVGEQRWLLAEDGQLLMRIGVVRDSS
jgi:hypothetical protein